MTDCLPAEHVGWGAQSARYACLWRSALTVCACLLIGLSPLLAQPPARGGPAGLQAKLGKRGDLTLHDTSLRQALFTISEIWDINLVVRNEVEGKVNGIFKQAPLGEVLDSILLANGYGYRPIGQGMVVMPLEELGDLNSMCETESVQLRAAGTTDVIGAARMFSSPHGKIEEIPSAQTLLVADYPDRVKRIREFLESADRAAAQAMGGQTVGELGLLQVMNFSPQYIKASSLHEGEFAA